MQINNLSAIELFTLTLYGEARGEGIAGQVAVGNVIMNRARKSDQLISQVVLAPKQFSCWNENDPNRTILEKIAESGDWNKEKQLAWIAEGLTGGRLDDNTEGATNYLTKNLFYGNNKPSWASKLDHIVIIGNHVFGSFT